jgi:regulator of replication initiation timing
MSKDIDTIYVELVDTFEALDTRFEEFLEEYTEQISIENKKLKDALVEQVNLQQVFGSIVAKIKNLKDTVDHYVSSIHADAMNGELRNAYKSVNVTEAKSVANSNKMYRKFNSLAVQVAGLLYDADSAMETVTTRKYILNNMSNAIIASVENTVI